MIKIEAITLEDAYSDAAKELQCSVTNLVVEVVQYPSSGVLGFFRKKAIIVAAREKSETNEQKKNSDTSLESSSAFDDKTQEVELEPEQVQEPKPEQVQEPKPEPQAVTEQKEPEIAQEQHTQEVVEETTNDIASEVEQEVNALFDSICFDLDAIKVSLYDENTLYVELSGADAALLIGKEGYRYKALSYMLFNWINAKYNLQLRLEIAEFLQNQEEAVCRYLESVKENIERDGRAQTKILDGVLVQIALRELRETYPQKYVAIRTTRDGLKYIIVNDYNY